MPHNGLFSLTFNGNRKISGRLHNPCKWNQVWVHDSAKLRPYQYRALPTFWTLSSSTGLVCCRRKKELAILQNFTRVLLALSGQRHRMEHLIPITLPPAMLETLQKNTRIGRLGTNKRFQDVGRVVVNKFWERGRRLFLPIFELDFAFERNHGVFRTECH